MQKHIEKRCLTQFQTTEEIFDIFEQTPSGRVGQMSMSQFPRGNPQDFSGMLITEDCKVLMAFPHEEDEKVVMIPELNPVLLYFDTAYSSLKEIKERRKNLLDHFKGIDMDEHYMNALYSYYARVNTFMIMLFTAVEAFINYHIPEQYVHRKILTNKVKISDKDRIMRYFSFDDKLDILSEVFEKDFKITHPDDFTRIENLKQFRDSLIHLKPQKGINIPYAYIYRQGLSFRFEEAMDAAMNFMNFYKADFINYCPCANNF